MNGHPNKMVEINGHNCENQIENTTKIIDNYEITQKCIKCSTNIILTVYIIKKIKNDNLTFLFTYCLTRLFNAINKSKICHIKDGPPKK